MREKLQVIWKSLKKIRDRINFPYLGSAVLILIALLMLTQVNTLNIQCNRYLAGQHARIERAVNDKKGQIANLQDKKARETLRLHRDSVKINHKVKKHDKRQAHDKVYKLQAKLQTIEDANHHYEAKRAVYRIKKMNRKIAAAERAVRHDKSVLRTDTAHRPTTNAFSPRPKVKAFDDLVYHCATIGLLLILAGVFFCSGLKTTSKHKRQHLEHLYGK